MSGTEPRRASDGSRAGAGGPLNLIHTNKSPKPASMRVPKGFDLRGYLIRRGLLNGGADAAKSTG